MTRATSCARCVGECHPYPTLPVTHPSLPYPYLYPPYPLPTLFTPPLPSLTQAASSIGTAVTGAFCQLDEALEKAGALPELKPPATKGAFLTQEWEQVRGGAGLHS